MRFYVISNMSSFDDNQYTYGEEVDLKTGDFEKCEKCGSALGMREWLPPRKVKLSKRSYGDFVFGTFATFLCSEEFKNAYELSTLKGIVEFQDVEVVKVARSNPKVAKPIRYYAVKIIRSSVEINEKLSALSREEKEVCDKCRTGTIKSFNGIFIETSSWKGEDIFYPIGLPGTIIVSQRFYDFVIQNKFTNIKLIPAEKYKPIWSL